jgi:putative phage-type endonuclease
MLTDAQIEFRKTGVGGSDVAAIWGINPYKQAIDVFYDKVGPEVAADHGYQAEKVGGFAIDRGNIFEAPVGELYTKITGNKLRNSNIMHRHAKYPWLIANLDKKIQGVKKLLEIKTVSAFMAREWGPPGTDQVAEYYTTQPHHYMLVLDYPAAELAAMIGMDDLRIYEFERDSEMDELIIETTHDFWHNNVLKCIPPDIDPDVKSAGKVLKRVYNQVNDETVTLPDSAMHWHQVKLDAQEIIKEQNAVVTAAKHHLARLAGNAGRIYIPGVKGAYVRELKKVKGYVVEDREQLEMRYKSRAK